MSVKSKEEIMNAIRENIGDRTDDVSISLIEDISDTIDDYENRTKDRTDWKSRFEENDANWRKRYHDRFFNSSSNEDAEFKDDYKEKDEVKNYSYDSLFVEEKEK